MEELEILHNVFFVLLYGGVITLDVVAALYLLLRRGNAIAPEVTSPVRLRRWAAAFLLATALSHMFWLYYAFHISFTVYTIVCFLDLLTLIPTMTGVLLSMLQDRHRSVWPVLVLLIPAFILSTLCVIREDSAYFIPAGIYVYALYALLMLYIFFAVRRYGRWLRDNYADLEHKEVMQSFLILIVFLLFFVMYSSTSEGSGVLVYLLQIDSIIIAALLLWRVETLQQLSEEASPVAEPAVDEQKASVRANIGSLLKKHCEDKQLYLQHDLTLANLAQAVGTNRYYLSQHFAQQGITYNAYINDLRIRHFVRLYHEAVADQRTFTAQQLAFESGYHSYSTFSATFKQNMGTTVTAWMHSAQA
ncbi:MAG: helix-turn-helix transcriptional regulator [Clostridia bacterium]|nr:helix-turn-helix transcriptional regulator [Clostridia bacterium]